VVLGMFRRYEKHGGYELKERLMGSDGNSKRGSFGYEDVSDEEDVRYNKEIVFR